MGIRRCITGQLYTAPSPLVVLSIQLPLYHPLQLQDIGDRWAGPPAPDAGFETRKLPDLECPKMWGPTLGGTLRFYIPP